MSGKEEMNQEYEDGYKSIFKATSLFGGVQVINIIIQIIKQKFVAILLGPTGMGIVGLYTSTTSLVQGLTSMGLSASAVKNVAEAFGSNDVQKINRVVNVFRKLVWFTGVLGMITVLVLAPYLSRFTFGNYDFTFAFLFLSITLLLQQISSGQSVVLRGMRKLKDLAKSSVLGSFYGLIISVPIYYFFGVDGIVPSLILSAITTLILTWYFSRKIKIEKIKTSSRQTLQEGKEMLKMGVAMSLNSILVLGVAYLIRIFIVKIGGTEEVGYYSAGFAIINGYVGMIFTAMGTDFYPRLASVNKDNEKCRLMVNQQAEIAILILTPILLLFLLFIPFAMNILYSPKFASINGFMQWAIIGILFKAVSWAISFQFIAKQDMRVFAINETIANINILWLSLLCYYWLGLNGLGIAFTLSYLLYLIQISFITKRRYGFKFTSEFKKLYLNQIVFAIVCFLFIYFWKSNWVYIPTALLTIICIIYSFNELDKRIGLKMTLFTKLWCKK